MRGQEVKNEVIYSDFKPIDDMIMPFSFQIMMNGQVGQTINLETVEFDNNVDMKIFDKPEPVKTETEAPK